MVIPALALCDLACRLLAAAEQPLLLRLDGPTRAKLLAALAALVLLGLAMMLLVSIGARMTRRYVNRPMGRRSPRTAPLQDDWASKPLVPGDDVVKPTDRQADL